MNNPFLPEQLLTRLRHLPQPGRYWVALSGGLDSTVLLHALAQLVDKLSIPVSALHVDHGLSPDSVSWSARCRHQCEELGVDFVERRVAFKRQGRGLEAAAREARYAAFAEVVGAGEMLLTAHHEDDQAETLLLQLLRGGGVRGLAAMPECRLFTANGGRGWLGRPLLCYSRQALQAYALAQGLDWIEDPSNFDTTLQRNYLRHELLPLLDQRHPGIGAILARSAGHFAESAELLDELARQDLENAAVPGTDTLSVHALGELTAERRRNLLRYWLRSRHLPVPDSRNLARILDEVLPAAPDAEPLVRWPGAEVRRYRDSLHAIAPLPPPPDDYVALPWSGDEVMVLPCALGELRMTRVMSRGVREELLGGEVTIGWRRGGEKIAPPERGGRHALKKLYQEAGIPPWERDRCPLLYLNGELAQVAGLWSDRRFACGKNEQGIQFEWRYAIEKAGENDDN